ncbi:MAG: glycoside hydrolase family 88 protein [Bacteroidota bacterium]
MYKPSKTTFYLLFSLSIFVFCCSINQPTEEKELSSEIDPAFVKMRQLLEVSNKENKIPRSEDEDGKIVWATKTNATSGEMQFDWTLGFWPGSCWYMYELTGDKMWSEAAAKFQAQFEPMKTHQGSHDLGFVFYCSYGNGFRLESKEEYKNVLIEAGNTLMKRFNYTVGCIQSWDVDKGWQAERGWQYPVIIDNMMNLEMLFELTELTGNKIYREAAISHADVTLANHFRADNSSWHVVDYDPLTGEVRKKNTAQGFSHESAWARGQAWGLYGFTVCYRYTKDKKYLDRAQKIAEYIINHPRLPEDGIPYWDMDADNIPEEPRDASAAAITAAALAELNTYLDDRYQGFLEKVMTSLSSERYMVVASANTKFILDHSVGSVPHGAEIDQPLSYADYYYLETRLRMEKSHKQTSLKAQILSK